MTARATATSPAGARGRTTDAPRAPRSASATSPRRRLRPTRRAAILSFVVALLAVFAVGPARAYLDQRAQLEQLQRQADQLAQQNVALERRIADLNDPTTLERLARQCLGMVRPGEVAFVPIPKGQAPTPPDCG
ncbi:MAG TPA: septum formation initiator family protein [Actinomycetota bacterium]|nr:septum formation initiator family protein [Actinomycetota bacterium]